MATNCYAMVRGSVIRITRLDARGSVLEGERSSLVSRNVAKVAINEVSDSRPEVNEKDDRSNIRLYTPSLAQTIRYQADVDFAITDPDAIELTTGQPVVLNAAGDVVGWDAKTRVRATPFALEVWSALDDASRAATGYRYGYTLFPFLRGGLLDGMTFGNGGVSFSIKGARTMKGARWGSGPYDINVAGSGDCGEDPVVGFGSGGFGVSGFGGTTDTSIAPGFGLGGFGVDAFGGGSSPDSARPIEAKKNTMWTNLLVKSAPVPTCGAVAL